MYSRQCVLQKESMVSIYWIPEELAVVGKSIVVKKTGETWVVKEVWGRMLTKDLVKRERDYLHHREATDI